MLSHDAPGQSVATQFLHTEVSRLGAQPGLRSLPPGPDRDFLTLTWGPIVYRTSYSPESGRVLPVFLRALNDAIREGLHRLPGTEKQIHVLEASYASRVFSLQEQYEGASEVEVREFFHNWKVSLSLPSIELPVRLRLCLVVDDRVIASFAEATHLATQQECAPDYSRCRVRIIEENFPDLYRRDSNPAVGLYPGWTTVVLSALVEVYNGLRQGKGLVWYHRPGSVYTGNEIWEEDRNIL